MLCFSMRRIYITVVLKYCAIFLVLSLSSIVNSSWELIPPQTTDANLDWIFQARRYKSGTQRNEMSVLPFFYGGTFTLYLSLLLSCIHSLCVSSQPYSLFTQCLSI